MDELEEAANNLTINDAKYYESNTSTASDAQGDLTCNLETVNHTSNGNETVTHTSNVIFEQKLLSNRSIPVVVPMTNLMIDQRIAPIILEPQTLLTPATKEVAADAASGGTWVNKTLRKVSQTGVSGSTPGNICNNVSGESATSPVLIEIVDTSPPCGLDMSL